MSCATNESPFDIYPRDISYDDLNLRAVRSLVFHLLYAAEAFEYDVSLEALIENFNRGFDLQMPKTGLAAIMIQKIINQRHELDEQIKPLLHNWRFERLGICTKLILRYALWELRNSSFPPAVIINEAIELAKCFSEKDAYKFINGILDEAVKKTEATMSSPSVSPDVKSFALQ